MKICADESPLEATKILSLGWTGSGGEGAFGASIEEEE